MRCSIDWENRLSITVFDDTIVLSLPMGNPAQARHSLSRVPSIRRLRKWVHRKTWEVSYQDSLSICFLKCEKSIPNTEFSKKKGTLDLKLKFGVALVLTKQARQIIILISSDKISRRSNLKLFVLIRRSITNKSTTFWMQLNPPN